MANNKVLKKLADVPLAKPGFEALGMSAPFIVQMNPEGKWENTRPANLDEDRLKSIVHHLISTKAISAAQNYCSECASENQTPKMKPQYVPVVMMPILPADQCPFDMDCEVQKIREAEKNAKKQTKKKITTKADEEAEDKEKDKIRKTKKRGFVMQRLTDFDLLSQW